MQDAIWFASGIALTTGITLGVIRYLMPHMRILLVDLCGTIERANFWAAFSNVTVGLVPLIFALNYRPESRDATEMVHQLGDQLEQGLLGLVLSVVVVGVVLGISIPRDRREQNSGARVDAEAR